MSNESKELLIATTPFTVDDLMPSYFSAKGVVQTYDDLLKLGQPNLRVMIRRWRSAASSHAERIKRLDEMAKFLEDPAEIAEIRAKHEDPVFEPHEYIVHPDSWSGSPEPNDARAQSRKSDATTLNKCGWCKYSGGGTCRYRYHITTSCSFLTNADMESYSGYGEVTDEELEEYRRRDEAVAKASGDEDYERALVAREFFESKKPGIRSISLGVLRDSRELERRFDTPCWLRFADEEEREKVIKGIRASLDATREEKEEADRKIQFLLKLEKFADSGMPVLCGERPADHFEVDDEVMSYIGTWNDHKDSPTLLTDKKFVDGRVIYGYRHQDGCVSMRFTDKVHAGDYLDGHGSGCGMSVPYTMLRSEYEYLRDHPEYAQLWISCVGRLNSDEVDVDGFLDALEEARTQTA